jgi:dGTPase
VRDLFAHYSAHPGDLPEEWQAGLKGLKDPARARSIADFIAGMTDRYALAEHARLSTQLRNCVRRAARPPR